MMNIRRICLASLGLLAVFALALPSSAEPLETQLDEARQLYADGAYAEALTAFETILSDQPDLAEAHLFRGHAAFALEQFDQARHAYARAIEAGRLDAALLGRLTQIEQRSERAGSALAALRLLLLVTPDQPELHLAAAEAYAAAGLDSEAELLYRQVIRIRPSDSAAPLRLANLHLSRDRWREAIEPLTLAYHLDDADADRARALGNLHSRADQPEAAIAWYQRAMDTGGDKAAVHLRLAHAWLALGDREAARAAADRAASEQGASEASRALLLLGQLAREDGQPDEAVRYWQQAARHPDVPSQVHVYLGSHAYEQARFADAVAHFAAASETGRADASIMRLLVLSYLGNDQPQHAQDALLAYIEQHGMDRTARELVERITRH